jgi:prepilin-type N-terminal cleavage/methylation domain-containing protein
VRVKKKGKAFTLLEMLIVLALLGTLIVTCSMKGLGYLKLYKQSNATKEYQRTLRLFSEYAQLENISFVVNFEQKNGKTWVKMDEKEGLSEKIFSSKNLYFEKKIKEKKICFHRDGSREILDQEYE